MSVLFKIVNFSTIIFTILGVNIRNYSVILFVSDGTEPHGPPKKHRLYLNVTEVGSERSSSTGGQYLQVILNSYLYIDQVFHQICNMSGTGNFILTLKYSTDCKFKQSPGFNKIYFNKSKCFANLTYMGMWHI